MQAVLEMGLLLLMTVFGFLSLLAGMALLSNLLMDEEERTVRTVGLCAACLFFGSMDLGYLAAYLSR